MDSVIECHHYMWSTFTWKINVTVKRVKCSYVLKKIFFVFVIAQFEYMCDFCSLICEYICVLPLNYMQCLCNVVAPLELDQSGTHTLWTKWGLSLKLELLWQFCMIKSVIWGWKHPYKFDDRAKLFVAWLSNWRVSVVVITWGQVMV